MGNLSGDLASQIKPFPLFKGPLQYVHVHVCMYMHVHASLIICATKKESKASSPRIMRTSKEKIIVEYSIRNVLFIFLQKEEGGREEGGGGSG